MGNKLILKCKILQNQPTSYEVRSFMEKHKLNVPFKCSLAYKEGKKKRLRKATVSLIPETCLCDICLGLPQYIVTLNRDAVRS